MVSEPDAPALLSERISSFLRFNRLAQISGYPKFGPYLFLLAAWILGGIILSGISYSLTSRSQFETPYVLILPIGLIIAVTLAKWIRDQYVKAIKSLPDSDVGKRDLLPIPIPRISELLLILIYVGHLLNLAFSPEEVSAFVAVHGEFIAYIKYLFMAPFYFIVIADITALLAASMFFVPWNIYIYIYE